MDVEYEQLSDEDIINFDIHRNRYSVKDSIRSSDYEEDSKVKFNKNKKVNESE